MARYLNQTRTNLFTAVWQVIEIVSDPGQLGRYTLWVLLNSPGSSIVPTLHSINLTVSRNFYVNLRSPKPSDFGPLYRKVSGNASTGRETGSASGHILPRNHTVYHLYEYNVPEDVYIEHASEIATDLARPDIEGVYELGVPSLFRVLMKLGCLCTVDREALKKTDQFPLLPDDTSFNLDQLRFCSLAQHPYLSGHVLRHVFLFHYQLPSFGQAITKRDSQRQLYLLIVPWTGCGYICVIDTSKINQLPDLNGLYVRQRTKLFPHSANGEFPPVSLTFETHIESDAVNGRRVVQRWIASLRQGVSEAHSKEINITGSQSAAPVVILLHSSITSQQAIAGGSNEVNWPLNDDLVGRRRSPQLTALTGFPVIQLGGTMDEGESQTSGDTEAGTGAYSLLNWQQTAIKRGIRYFLQSEARLERQLELARYLHIPVGNIPVAEAPLPVSLGTFEDQDVQSPASSISAIELGCDLFYARHLIKHNHVLWCSSSDRPDLGGKETDDQRLLLEMEESGVAEVNRPGCYPYVNVELELSNLAVNTLIVANRIPELEGATLLSFDRLSAADKTLEEQLNQGVNLGAQITNYDETAACSAAFRVLRNMVMSWVRDVTQYQNPLADEQIIYFYQWLRSPRSLFYDPALRRTVQKLMKKVFLKLVDELSHFHVDVIYANFSRVIISTHRIELPEALARVDYFTQLLRTRPGTLFTHIDLQYVTSWRQLLWMDSANYAGVKASVENLVDGKDVEWSELLVSGNVLVDNPDDKENNAVEQTDASLSDPELDMQWHIARYLPETRGLRSKFQSLLAGYILATYSAIRKEHRRLRGLTSSQSLQNESSQSPVASHVNVEPGRDSDCANVSETSPYQSDATVSPGVREYQERLLRDQLAPELYNLIIRLQRKAAWIDPELMKNNHSSNSTCNSDRLNSSKKIQRNNEIVTVYLAEKSVISRLDYDDTDMSNHDLILPLLPPHQAVYSLCFTPLLDFIKSLCEVLSLEPSIQLQMAGIRRDLLRLINIGEFSSEAVWIAPHMTRDCLLHQDPNQHTFETTAIRSLLIYLPEVACPTCNFTRDIDVCRDIHVVWILSPVNNDTRESGHWAWICPHCRTVYPRARLEEALVQQLEQISLQHCLQDLQCPKCVVGGGIQEALLANGGSVAQCADCSTKLMPTVPTGYAVYRRLDVYRNVGLYFGFEYLEKTASWLIQGLQR